MQIREISPEELGIIERFGTCLIEFYDSYSNEQNLIKNEIEKISDNNLYYLALRFDINKDVELAKKFNVTKPTLLMIRGNEILGREESFMNSEKISEWAHFSVIMGW